MKTKLFYFSGTGNNLFIAKKIRKKLAGSELISIPRVSGEKEINGEVIGIITPIYMFNMPHIVADFVKKIKDFTYIFMVYAGAGKLGPGIKRTEKLFKEQHLKLSALFNVAMPSNYTPYGCPSESLQKDLFGLIDNRIDEIIDVVSNKKQHMDSSNTSFFSANIHPGILYTLGYKRIHMMDNSYRADDNCNSCGVCGQVCPVGNISLTGGNPVWNNKCQLCYACLQWCPQQAIQFGKNTMGVKRYHHPEITLKEIIESSGNVT